MLTPMGAPVVLFITNAGEKPTDFATCLPPDIEFRRNMLTQERADRDEATAASAAVLLRPDRSEARVKSGEVVALRRGRAMIGTDEVQLDQTVDRRAVKQAQDFRDDDGRGRASHEGRADGLAGE